jgi:hypothetical protein
MKVIAHKPVGYLSTSAKSPRKKNEDEDLPTSMEDMEDMEDTGDSQEEPSDSDKKLESIKQSRKQSDKTDKPDDKHASVKQIALYKQREDTQNPAKPSGNGPHVKINPIPSVDVKLSTSKKATVVMVIYNPTYPIGKDNGLFMNKDDFPIFRKAVSKAISYMKANKRPTKVDVRLMGAVYTVTYNALGMLLVFKDRDKLVISMSANELKVFMIRFV